MEPDSAEESQKAAANRRRIGDGVGDNYSHEGDSMDTLAKSTEKPRRKRQRAALPSYSIAADLVATPTSRDDGLVTEDPASLTQATRRRLEGPGEGL